MNKFYASLLIVVLTVFLYSCEKVEMKKSMKGYKGDGKIMFIDAPMLGVPGIAIEMPRFDLSKGIDIEYDLSGIPKGRVQYYVYLVVPEPCPLEKVKKGYCEFNIKNNEDSIILSSRIKDMTNSRVNGMNQFYFYDKGYIDVTETSSKWSVAVNCNNEILDEPVAAYILIESGGYK